ncbi:kinesin-like protein KIF20B [Venturia canescens]|uniref:kinesin-like protein KIF20B n=1 Tax=Venturia canescens TaxID=32260 RepID=UPI001C9C53A3|nr:kinesin-like protein KIF20B [Venturia canescens]
MERTLDSIRPSDVEGNNMTFLYSRDPSILAPYQRPLPSLQKNLISLYEDEEIEYPNETASSASESIDLQTIKVYLRMKPFPRKLHLSKEESEAYRITNSTTLITQLPTFDSTFTSVKGAKASEGVCRKFTFTQTFGPETTQLNLFEEIIQQRMMDFLAGQNCTVMTYGTTNSGKSYTLQGTTTSPGIIPRGLEYVFSNINPRPTPCYKPIHGNNVVSLNAVDRAQELEAKNKLLTFASIDKYQYINAYKQMQKLLQEESPIRASEACDAHYSVWVSFAEIYNENIYDLLSNECQKRRPPLKLAADGHDRAFIKGLRTVCVNSGSEAYQVLMAGQYNLKVAATALNARSSRSHCIFTIKLLKYYTENIPESVEVSTFTFCDLAGSERLKKTLNVGDRLKEAQNINTSLLVLGRCLKTIYEGQSIKQRQEHIGPFRESKLTRLFQRALSGKEQIALIVNVNPIPNLYTETQNVLNFAAIAKKIIIEPKKIRRQVTNTRFSQIVARSVKSTTDWDPSDLSHVVESSDNTERESDYINPDDYEDLLDENTNLKKELAALKASMLNKDLQIRQELSDTYMAMMKKLETDWKNRLKDVEAQSEDHTEWRINMVENFYKTKLNDLTSRKRRRADDSCSEDEAKDVAELEIENSRLHTKIHGLKKSMKHLRESNDAILTEKNKIAFELGLVKDELKSLKNLLATAQSSICKDDESLTYVEGLRKQLSDKQDHIKNLKEFLNEAKEEYISISSHAEMMEVRLKESEVALAETTENIADLKTLLDDTNACLEQKTKATDILEEKLNQQTIMMREAEERFCQTRAQMEETIRELTEKVKSLEKSSSPNEIIASSPTVTEIEIKKEILSESECDLSTDFPKIVIPDEIVIKTDTDEVLTIPSSAYRNDRESEMLVQVQEIALEENDDGMVDKLIELRTKLEETELENKSLKKKWSQSIKEIESLKESLDSTKQQFTAITQSIEELKKAQSLKSEARTLEQRPSLKDSESQTNAISITEGGNQTDAVIDHNKSMQTSFVSSSEDDKSIQTSFNENQEPVVMDTLIDELKIKCSQLEIECKEKQLLISKLEGEVESLRKINDSLEQQSTKDREELETLSNEIKSSENNLASAMTERDAVQKLLQESEEIRKKAETQISECREEFQQKITSLMNDLADTKKEEEKMKNQLEETEELRKKLETQFAESRAAHELDIANVNKELTKSKEQENMHMETIKVHLKEIGELKEKLATRTTEQDEKIAELNKCVERFEKEKKELEEKISERVKETEQLKQRLQAADKRDQEKDTEIKMLQKSYKAHISADAQDKKLHEEIKKNLAELLETREALARTDELYMRLKESSRKEIEALEAHVSALEKSSKQFKMIQQKVQTDKAEVEKYKTERDDLKALITQKDLEMQSFMSNRDAMIQQYENLVKSLQEDNERGRREITRFQELFHRLPSTPLEKTVKSEDECKKNVLDSTDLSDSEARKPRRRAAALPPPSSETKRSTRRKKLYMPVDDSCVDIETFEAVPPTPSPSASGRSLRTRRK